ncbi:hypothetical protein F406_gp035 [Agrobacterium phage 7-7-1]|uniref:Uncharacterized protein n=1 Tax=Agrobacterium phage 7-7-1 TaxID=1161931 RepID=J7F8Y9_9CAUD|nr:hypothetical protein F406_gp035 [Agrobacterium phage 7-7-1]AFH19780.1 hypothetical protein 7-7-1_00082 [Agrobacterium phage 7-7-1]
MKINMNDKVRLKLTEHGHMAMAMCEYLKYDKVDADGWLELHLWEAMLVFGPFMFNGNPNLPFETNIELKPSVEAIKREDKISQDEIALLFPDGLPVELMKVMFPEMSEPLTSDELRFLMKFVALDREYTVGPKTFERVFNAAGLTNLSDLQAVMDAIERALTIKPLEWKRGDYISSAKSVDTLSFNAQYIGDGDDGWMLHSYLTNETKRTRHPSREEAEAAAQEQHETAVGKYLQG